MEPNEAERAAKILRLISEDQSLEQVIEQMPGVTYDDIFAAAEQGAQAIEAAAQPNPYASRRGLSESDLKRVREEHPRAYLPWDAAEDAELAARSDEGWSAERIAEHFGREPGAIKSRLRKLRLDVD